MINILRRKEGIAKSSGKASMADRELMLRQARLLIIITI